MHKRMVNMTTEEEQRLIALGTGETLEYDRSKNFIDLFCEQAKKTPDAVAVVDKNSQLTYKELDEASDEYAKTVTPGTFVCLEMPRVKEFVVAVLGIWKAGSAYVPIDTEYPEERKKFMREECDGKPLPQPDIAYMIYTSGSTGKPKGAINTQEGVRNYISAVNRFLEINPSDRISMHRPFSFDAHLADLFPVLSTGASVYIMPEEIRRDVQAIAKYIKDNGITGGSYTTSIGTLLLETNKDLPLRYILMNGEKMTGIVSDNIQIFNGCGATECTDMTTMFKLERGVEYSNIPIGRPFANTYCFIIDKHGHLLPKGVKGELCYAGVQIALGYCNLPELSALKFTDCPFVHGLRMYHSGDLCHWNERNLLEYDGRIDNQVKLRGFRIELGEIESAALQIEGIQQAVAMVRNEQIVLYYTQSEAYDENTGTMSDRLTETLSSSLPEYMIPSAFVQLESMPLTPNGKIDRKALPEPEPVQEECVAPESRNEKLLCRYVEELLVVERIGITDSFKRLGMSSIQAMKLNMTLHKADIHLNIGAILKADNVKNLCRFIDEGIDSSEVGSWLDEYDKSKPTIVLCCGVIDAEMIYRNMAVWRDKFNIYILQPIFNAWSDIEQLSHEEIASRYFELLKRDIKGGIYCILGFSYGGEIAYYLATGWESYCGQKTMVLMGDTIIVHRLTNSEEIRHEYKYELEAYYYELQNEFFSKRKRLPIVGYDGKVILISALQDSPHREENEREWRQHNGDIRIIPMNDTHQGLYEHSEHYEEYLMLLQN